MMNPSSIYVENVNGAVQPFIMSYFMSTLTVTQMAVKSCPCVFSLARLIAYKHASLMAIDFLNW